MPVRYLLTALAIAALAGCANPLNRVTSDNYAETCAIAETNGQLGVAEQACYRAAVNVDWGNLGPEMKSQRLYNLARIKRKVGKFDEAISLLTTSLEIEATLTGPGSIKSGRRLAELVASYFSVDKTADAVATLRQLRPIADQYSGDERKFIAMLYLEAGRVLAAAGQTAQATEWEVAVGSLGFTANDLKR